MWITIAFISTAAVFVSLTIATLHHQRWARRLPPLETFNTHPDELPAGAMRCSVIVAARDEDARLESTVRHLLAQRHVALEVIVVDDRSTDATGDILRGSLPRIRACARDASSSCRTAGSASATHVMWAPIAATGDWLLFTDADCWLKPDVMARALRVAARDAADHVTMTPGVAAETLGCPGVASRVPGKPVELDFGREP